VNSMEQKTRVFFQIDVQEFHLSKYLLFGCAAKHFYTHLAWILCPLFKTASSAALKILLDESQLSWVRFQHLPTQADEAMLNNVHKIKNPKIPLSKCTVSVDAGIEPRTIATLALAIRCSYYSSRSHPQHSYIKIIL
jgi:hypothetical protein